jgi:glycosyltransferase involved in cell wall biosynthesis
MKILHWVGITPNACGLYEHAKDQIAAERMVGIDSQAIDFRIVDNKEIIGEIKTDDWLTSVGLEWTKEADINVIHSGINEKYKTLKPNVLILHGRPEYAFALALKGKKSHYQEYMSYRFDERLRKFVYFWPEHQFTWEMIFPKHKLTYVPSFINTNRFNPTGPKFDLKDTSGTPNILVADMWREDYTPFNVCLAAAEFIKKYCPTGKLHIFGLGNFTEPAIQGHLGILKDNEILGSAGGLTSDMPGIYRACDILISPTVIANRVVKEAMACGCVVVANQGASFTEFQNSDRDINGFAKAINKAYEYWRDLKGQSRTEMYNAVQKLFEIKQGGEAFLTLYKDILGIK